MWVGSEGDIDSLFYFKNSHHCTAENLYISMGTAEDYVKIFEVDEDSNDNAFLRNEVVNLPATGTIYDISQNNLVEAAGETVTGTVTLQFWGDSTLDSSAAAVTATLPDSTKIGQRKTIVMTDATNSSTVTVTHLAAGDGGDGEVGTFDAVGECWILEWCGAEWVTIKATCTFV